MGIEIQKASINAGDIHNFTFTDNIKQYFVGLTYCRFCTSNDSEPHPIACLSMSAEPLGKSGNTLPVKLNATPSSGQVGKNNAMVTVLALTGTDDEDYRMSPSMKDQQTFPIPGNPSILIPSLTAFSVSFNDGLGHYVHEFEVQAAAKQQPGNIAMMSSHVKMNDISGHYEHPTSYANGGIFAYAGMSENIRCTAFNLTKKTPRIVLESISEKQGVFISSFTMSFDPGVDSPLWSCGFGADSGYNWRTKENFVGCSCYLNTPHEYLNILFEASVNLIEILD